MKFRTLDGSKVYGKVLRVIDGVAVYKRSGEKDHTQLQDAFVELGETRIPLGRKDFPLSGAIPDVLTDGFLIETTTEAGKPLTLIGKEKPGRRENGDVVVILRNVGVSGVVRRPSQTCPYHGTKPFEGTSMHGKQCPMCGEKLDASGTHPDLGWSDYAFDAPDLVEGFRQVAAGRHQYRGYERLIHLQPGEKTLQLRLTTETGEEYKLSLTPKGVLTVSPNSTWETRKTTRKVKLAKPTTIEAKRPTIAVRVPVPSRDTVTVNVRVPA